MAGQNIAESATKVTVWLQRRLAMGEGHQEEPLHIGQSNESVVKSQLGKADGFVLVNTVMTEEFEEFSMQDSAEMVARPKDAIDHFLSMQDAAKTRTSPRDAIEQLLRGLDDSDCDSACSEIQREEAEMAMESDDEITMAELDASELDDREGGNYEDVAGECYSRLSVSVAEVAPKADDLHTDMVMGEITMANNEHSEQIDTSLTLPSANAKEKEADVDSAVEHLDQLVLAPVMPGAFEPQEPQRILRAGPPPFLISHPEVHVDSDSEGPLLPVPVVAGPLSAIELQLRESRREMEHKLRKFQKASLTDAEGGVMRCTRFFETWQACPPQATQSAAIPGAAQALLHGPTRVQGNAQQGGREPLTNLEANHAHLAHLRTQPKPWPSPSWAHVTTFVGAYSNLPENAHLQGSSFITVSREVYRLLVDIDGVGSIHHAELVSQTPGLTPFPSVGALTSNSMMGMVGEDIWANMLQVERDIWWWKHRLTEVRIRSEEIYEAAFKAGSTVEKWKASENMKVLSMVGEYISGEAERWRLANGVTKGVFAVL